MRQQASLCTGCGRPLGDGPTHNVNDYDAWRHAAKAGVYHDTCCPLPICQLGGLGHSDEADRADIAGYQLGGRPVLPLLDGTASRSHGGPSCAA